MKEEKPLNAEQKKKNRIRMLIGIGIVTLLAAVSYVLTSYPELFERKPDNTSPTSMYSDKLYSYIFYPTDYNLDVTKDEWYMQLDRYLHYKKGAVSEVVLPEEIAGYSDAVRFFQTYFDTVIAGDAETYNTFFTEEYYKNVDPYDRFAPQMLYDIEVEELSETNNDDGTTDWTFNVVYKIHRNDGTFRNDLDSDSSKKLFFELHGDRDGTVRINEITYYKRG